jgi:hypothetical protein
MNEREQTHWPAQVVTLLFDVMRVPMPRHLAHPQSGEEPLCGAQGTWERWETPTGEFDPASWRGCPACGRVLGWLVGGGEQVPQGLAALRQLLDDPAFGPPELVALLFRQGGRLTAEALPLLTGLAPVSAWQDDVQVSARGEHGTLIEAGIVGHIFPPGEPVVLVLDGEEGEEALHLEALAARAAVERAQAAGQHLRCVITRDRGSYWDRALFHLQPF